MTNKREYFAKFGIATKGIIYLLIGGLSAMTTLGLGGKETGSLGAFKYLAKQVYGQVILAIIAIGLTGYVFWRLYQTFIDKENNSNNFKTITGEQAEKVLKLLDIVTEQGRHNVKRTRSL